METAAQEKSPIQQTEQADEDLRTNVTGHLKQAGYNTTPNNINPNDRSSLEKIAKEFGGDLRHTVETTGGELIGAHVDYSRTTGNKSFLESLKHRFSRKPPLKKAA